ncbi:MAG: hypothetical protein GAK30_01297 [Paracidovorax wautersii]|uniref:Uncharacterized protein n=1 Tax=Paracidovorax wautersii TaxID=1177982 RepID=A0A7V8FQ17_9BURK|nr:MAG: hypothetical protein GAK30_01297 [Paracidovorax wautersii]
MALACSRQRGVAAAAGVLAVVELAGCASPASAPLRYTQLDCETLAREARTVQRTVAAYSGWSEDSSVTDAPGFLMWPAFAFLEEQLGADTRFDALQRRYLALARASQDRACPCAQPAPVNQAGVPRVPWNHNQAAEQPSDASGVRQLPG